MKTLFEENRILQSDRKYGPDPVLMKKKGVARPQERDITYYKERIRDKKYIEHAINRIAMELSHFLSK